MKLDKVLVVLGIAAICIFGVVLTFKAVSQGHYDAARQDWDNMVKNMATLPSCQNGMVKMTVVDPPTLLYKESPRVLLFGKEIKYWEGVLIEVKPSEVVVKYRNEILGTCRPDKQ